jgi:hypothetical protein
MLKHYFASTFLTSLLLSSATFAKPINLYNEPKKEAKTIGTLDSEAGIISIFTPKNSEWMKVADPRNGNVGWIKSSEINNTRMTFNVMSSQEGGHSYQIIQYGNSKPYTEDQLKQMQARQEALQKDMQKMVANMFDDFHHPWMNFPMIMPVVVIPEKAIVKETHVNQEKNKKLAPA